MCHIVTAAVLTRLVTALVFDGIVILRYTALVVRTPRDVQFRRLNIVDLVSKCVDHLSLAHAGHGTMKEQGMLVDLVTHSTV